jgi:hypothetical protein
VSAEILSYVWRQTLISVSEEKVVLVVVGERYEGGDRDKYEGYDGHGEKREGDGNKSGFIEDCFIIIVISSSRLYHIVWSKS